MLKEIPDARQVPGEGRRRWFCDDYFDLVVWYDDDDVTGFQLTYDLGGTPRALTWERSKGCLHTGVDDGEEGGRMKMSPILVPDGLLDAQGVVGELDRRSSEIDPPLVRLVRAELLACGGRRPTADTRRRPT